MKVPEILLIESLHRPGSLATILRVIGDHGLVVQHLDAVERFGDKTHWEITLEFDDEVDTDVLAAIDGLPNARILGRSDRVFDRHRGGKIRMIPRVEVRSNQQLRDIYTPGVARVCLAIEREPGLAHVYTNRPNTVAIVTNGTAILGLGDIGPVAGLPVMEGKSALMAQLAGLTGVPILIDDRDPQRIIETVAAIAPSFGAIQLEDIAAPECFEIERALIDRLSIPVLHDDQHGTAVVTLAALLVATRRVGVELRTCKVGQIGLGAAGLGIAGLLGRYGVAEVLGSDLREDALQRLDAIGGRRASLEEIMQQADVVVATTGRRGLIKPEWVRPGQIILALSNPDAEIEPDVARRMGAVFAADGKSVNNVLGYPGLFRGALDARASRFTDGMLIAAASAIANLTPEEHLVPDALDKRVHAAVADAVAAAVMAESMPTL
jgi:malate dehydrogenase (oxaloacetate-decarboxylating)